MTGSSYTENGVKMSEVKWIKISTSIFDNRKIRIIESMPEGDAIIVIWLKLLCLAGIVNDDGLIYITQEIPYTEDMLATQFNRPLSTVRLALETFKQFGMVNVIDDILHVSSWEKYQNIEGMERIREQNRIRKQNQRERERLALEDMSRDTSREVTQQNKNKNIDIDKDNKKNKRFTAPSVNEVRDYCNERGNKVDAQSFVDFYESKGWKVGNQSMKDWKAAVRTWERRKKDDKPAEKKTAFNSFDQRSYDYSDLESRLLGL